MRYRNLILIVVLIALVAVFILLRRGKPDEKVHQVFAADSTKVGGFELYNSADTIAVSKVGDQWMLVKPIKWAASADRMRFFHMEVLKATYSGIPVSEDPKSHATYNLDSANATHVKLLDRSGKLLTHVLFGNAGNPFDYFRLEGKNEVYRVHQKILGYFEPDPAGWRSPSVLSIPPEQLVKVNVSHPKNTYTLSREGNLWYYADALEQFQIPEYNQTMGKILNILARLESGNAEDGSGPALSTYSREAEVIVTQSDGKTHKLNFLKQGENYFVMMDDDATKLFQVPFDALFRFTRHAATFRILVRND